MNYEQGLEQLKQRLQGSENYLDLVLYEARLQENLDQERRYGSNEQTRASRAQIVDQLNRLAYERLRISFTDLCSRTSLQQNPLQKQRCAERTRQQEVATKSSTTSPSAVFLASSDKDKKYLEELKTHLAHAIRKGTVYSWDETQIMPGARWKDEIDRAIQSSKVAVLLVSADFLASDFIATYELPSLLEAAGQGRLSILSVIVRPCAFEDTELAPFWTVNPASNPLSRLSQPEREEVWLRVVDLIKNRHTPKQYNS